MPVTIYFDEGQTLKISLRWLKLPHLTLSIKTNIHYYNKHFTYFPNSLMFSIFFCFPFMEFLSSWRKKIDCVSNVFVSHNKRSFLDQDAFILENLLCRWKRLIKMFVLACCWKKCALLPDYWKNHFYCSVFKSTRTKVDILI